MAVISKDLGAVTAYAAAVNRGYTGTKEEFETLMASYAYVGEQAAESATSAGRSATNASQSATDAETAKGTAQQAATDAQTAQASAQESAQSAQQSAQSASQSAQSAESAKDTAVDAVDGFAAGAQQALDSVNQAGINWKSLAQAQALDSEAWAVGTRDGEDVGAQDETYHNNAKYYAEQGGTSAQTATEAAQTATQKAGEAAQSASAAAESARTLTIDATLTQSGQAADASETGNKITSLKEDLSKSVGDLKSAITYKMQAVNSKNKWNTADVVIGYVAANGNRNTTSTTYRTITTPISVSEGDVVRFYGDINGFGSVNARFVCAYDENGNAVPASGSTADTRTYTVPSGIHSIIPSFLASASNVMVTINEVVTEYEPYSTPHYIATEEFLPQSILDEIDEIDELAEKVRPTVNVYASDTEEQIISKLVNAFNTGNCDVVFERAVYTFGTALATVKTDYNLSGNNEIPIGNGCRYFFNGSTLNAVIDLATLGTDFYCNLFGSQNIASDYELHDGILNATDVRYVVHDEAAGKVGTYKHVYQNMYLTLTTNLRTEAIRKCVGGGTGQSGVVEMIGCKFTTDGTDSAVSFHGNATDYAGSKFMLSVRDCWISNSLRAGELSASQTGRLLYTGNSSGAKLQTYDRWDVTAFLNEVR